MIRQRETAIPEDRPVGTAQPLASIAPDGLEAFARDLRALRAKADLDYPEMAEVSHYDMKTLASAAGRAATAHAARRRRLRARL